MESATSSSPSPELAAALHRLRSTLARLKAELELAEAGGTAVPVDRLLGDLNEALVILRTVDQVAFGLVSVLVVDDDARLAELTARSLRRLGYDADSAGALRGLRPREVVIFDLGLARGLDESARSALRAARPIVVTGATDPTSRALAASLDANDYLVKPVELEDLVAAINRRMEEVR
ncbi:MAG: response regulator [Candidatus Dormibacteraeota bacterium]|nr:response regulator [Candidatus Dormibacteraeota bacterium]